MELLEGTVRDYAWGSPSGIPEILGRTPDGTPVAELWLGAHPQGPAAVRGREGVDLHTLIGEDPGRLLGAEVLERYGPRLPFLLKLLSARTALSIQTHPSLTQARAGFAAEEAAGIPRGAPGRSYRDAWHKPELVCALTEFHALCGFRALRALRATVERFRAVADSLPGREAQALEDWWLLLDPAATSAEAGERFTLERTLAALLGERERYGALADALADSSLGEAPADHASREGTCTDPLVTLRETNRDFRTDPGALVAVMLRRFRLEPGECLALEAGVMHAYLGGLAVEIMASSDNVLRGGLTSKHIDVEELRRTALFSTAAPRVQRAVGGSELRGSTDDFALTVVDTRHAEGGGPSAPEVLSRPGPDDPHDRELGRAPQVLSRPGPLILLCTEGEFSVTVPEASGTGPSQLALGRGDAVFVGADEPRPAVRGTGLLFAASTAL